MVQYVVMRKGGGGKVAINPEQVAFIRSAAGAFTDVFFNGQQVAVEGTFEEVLTMLSRPERRAPSAPPHQAGETQRGLVFRREA